ncbi:hypothetical protein SAMN05660337_0373 [Maridesulfovibrio ferrireducens]|uniref:Uncharacterized protein n=1 Tax=Maridesulfovibrio ferrireducens TaxID=246191 RepID=A0A1G9BQ18_9BACT|nr:hypothetical protein [Maridesulfovibrio ferrireducens]SDK41360.1 hypothetical protein SAMN05660337_0373 [Maridesulfovibrio ferrireducens]
MSFRDLFISYCKDVVRDTFCENLFTKWQIIKLYLAYTYLPFLLVFLPFELVWKLNLFVILFCFVMAPFLYTTIYVYKKVVPKSNNYFILLFDNKVTNCFAFGFLAFLMSDIIGTMSHSLRGSAVDFSYLVRGLLFIFCLSLSAIFALKKQLHSDYRETHFGCLFLFTLLICAPYYIFIESSKFFFLSQYIVIDPEALNELSYRLQIGIGTRILSIVHFGVYLFVIKMFIIAVIKQNDLNIARFEKETQ